MSLAADNEFEFIDLSETTTEERVRLTEEFYNEVYVPAFPEEDLREPLDVWLSLLHPNRESRPPLPVLHIIIARDQGARPTVHGGIVFEFYRRSICGMATYGAVRPESRRRGLAAGMLNVAFDILYRSARRRATEEPPLLFAEVEDPRRAPDKDSRLRAELSVSVNKALGFLACDMPYIQPALGDGKDPVDSLILLVHGRTAGHLGAGLRTGRMKKFLSEFYESLCGKNPWKITHLKGVGRWLDSHEYIPIRSLESIVGEAHDGGGRPSNSKNNGTGT